MKRDYDYTAMAVALATAEELDRMLDRVVEDDFEQVNWVVHEAIMLRHWAEVVIDESPSRAHEAQELIIFAMHAQVLLIGDVL